MRTSLFENGVIFGVASQDGKTTKALFSEWLILPYMRIECAYVVRNFCIESPGLVVELIAR